jgi:hypothetical protein
MGVETKYYVDSQGNYLGGYSEGNPAIPVNAIEVAAPPPHGWQKWNGVSWDALTPEQEAEVNA